MKPLLAFSMAVALVACGGKPQGKPEAPGQPPRDPGAAGKPSAEEKPHSADIYEDKFRIGKTATAAGVAMNETNTFSQGETIHVSFVVWNAPPSSEGKVTWQRADNGVTAAEEHKPLGEKGFASFEAATSTWSPGSYRLLKSVSDPAKPGSWKTLGVMDVKLGPPRQ